MEQLTDDPLIPDDEILYRRVSPDQITKPDGQNWRPSSQVFKTRQMSVRLASLVSAEEVLEGHPGFGLVSFTAKIVREAGCIIARHRDDPIIGHALVCPNGNVDGRISNGIAHIILKSYVWIKLPEVA
ncbi:MAG: hypothetical protein CO149_04805 [Nitrospirae bacterium CG_4_9_14_3_um_filter_51_5]|nr:MAG: hypothetical protein CO149_04805 [Nitrospirae bacterium CG_4_9_14_3_um_filter_51_5]